MINEIYIDGEIVETPTPKKKFKNGFSIRCTNCSEFIDRKWFENKILDSPYECKKCVLTLRNPMYNPNVKQKHDSIVKSDEYRENMRLTTLGEKNGFYGKTHTKETMDTIKGKLKTYWETMDDETYKKHQQITSDRERNRMVKDPIGYSKQKAKAARASHKSQFRSMKMNKIEERVYNFLIENDINIEYSVILASYQYDFRIKDKRILIEVDGDYWHGNPNFYNENGDDGKRKLNETQKNKILQDIEKTKWAESRGFTLIRIWEDDINNENYKEILKKELL